MTETEHNIKWDILPSVIFILKTHKDEEQKHIIDLIKNGVEEGLQVTVYEVFELSLICELLNLPAPYLA